MTTTHKFLAGLALFVTLAVSSMIFVSLWTPSETNAGEGGPFADQCVVNTVLAKPVGTASTRLFATSTGPSNRRAWIRVQQPLNATNTIAVVLNQDAPATISSGIPLPNATTTTGVPSYLEFGLNTDLPYIGSVTAISSTGGAVVQVTECLY